MDRLAHRHHRLILDSLPDDARIALDVGCGDGTFARALSRRGARVQAIDRDEQMIRLARAGGGRVAYLHGDFLEHPFEPASFDVVVSIAALHHMSSTRAFARMSEILRPGGTLALIGLAKSCYPEDLLRDAVGFLASRALRGLGGTAPAPGFPIVWPPPETFREVRRKAERMLPGVRYRRLLTFRYLLVWTKPHAQSSPTRERRPTNPIGVRAAPRSSTGA